jgi:anti-sigma regulatory factor (Ser/Thr protein kinase)
MKIEININEDEIERLMEDTGKKRADVQDALEEYFHAIVEDNSDEREDFVLTVLDDIVEDED